MKKQNTKQTIEKVIELTNCVMNSPMFKRNHNLLSIDLEDDDFRQDVYVFAIENYDSLNLCTENEIMRKIENHILALAENKQADSSRDYLLLYGEVQNERELLNKALKKLPPVSRAIIKAHYGIGQEAKPMIEIAREIGIAIDIVEDAEKKGIEDLRNILTY